MTRYSEALPLVVNHTQTGRSPW